MMVRAVITVATVMTVVYSVSSARILAMLPIGAKSHQRFMQPLVMTLARAGHHVVVYSPYPTLLDDQPQNLTHVHLENMSEVDKDMDDVVQEITDYPLWKCLDLHWSIIDQLYSEFVNDKKIKELFLSDEKFDLIITEAYSSQEFIAALLFRKFKVPVIGVQAFPTNNLLNSFSGNSLSLSYIPDTCTPFSNKMSLTERIANAFASLRGLYYHYNNYIPKLDTLMGNDFADAPSVKELSNIVSLTFVNDHLTADYAHPRTPNIIPVAGLHVRPPKPLPQEILKFVDESKDGVIFFSLGTYVLDHLQPKEYFEMYINVFKNVRQRVIWKTRKTDIEGLPPNVMTVTWAPQNDILAHPKCVLFITHGGQLSRVEALHFGVPIVAIAQFYDQHKNAEFYKHKGVGVSLKRLELTEGTVSEAINKVLHNSSYRENMKRLSAIFRDHPLSPAESVVFWTEYVLRHGGAAHLRPASTELRWYQLIFLDVIFVVAFTIFFLLSGSWLIFKRIRQLFRMHCLSEKLYDKKVN